MLQIDSHDTSSGDLKQCHQVILPMFGEEDQTSASERYDITGEDVPSLLIVG